MITREDAIGKAGRALLAHRLRTSPVLSAGYAICGYQQSRLSTQPRCLSTQPVKFRPPQPQILGNCPIRAARP